MTNPTAHSATGPTVEIVSFGYLHGDPPPAHITIDLRAHFRDPHVTPTMRTLTAHHSEVRAAVLATPGIPILIGAIARAVLCFLDGPSAGPVTVALGCAGGRHRAAAVAMGVRKALQEGRPGYPQTITLTHRDLDKDVVERTSTGQAAR